MADDVNVEASTSVDHAVAPTHDKGLISATPDAPVLLVPIGDFLPPELDKAMTAEAMAAYRRADSKRKLHALITFATRKAFAAAVFVANAQAAERMDALEARIAKLEGKQ